MQHTEGSFKGDNGLTLFCQTWLPDMPPKAVVAVVHGFGEHSSRYMNLVNALVPMGYALYSYDLRGHGRSEGARGHITNWSELRLDVDAFLRMVAFSDPKTPIFLYGHSFGGLIVLDYVLHDPVNLKGVIASAPSLGKVGISPILLTVSRVMSRVYPSLSMSTKLDATMISRDPAVVLAYKSDPLVHDKASARLGTEMTAAQDYVFGHADKMRIPLLMFNGDQDRLTSPADVKRFYDMVPGNNKQYIVYQGSFHEVHNDLDQARLLADIGTWLERNL